MWTKIAKIILRNRFSIIGLLLAITGVMAYFATFVGLDYNFAKLLPENDPTYLDHAQFKEVFGKDGNIIVIGMDDELLFKDTAHYNNWYRMGQTLRTVKGIDSVFSVAHLYNIVKNTSDKRFELEKLTKRLPRSNAELDSIRQVVHALPFYRDVVYVEESNTYAMMVFVNPELFDSPERGTLVEDVQKKAEKFGFVFSDLKFSGLPFIRSTTMTKVRAELRLFVILAMLVTGLLLFLFFRSFKVVMISMVVVAIGVVISFGLIGMLGYKITILMGLIPPLIIVIGIPNCVYLINKYQQEYRSHGNQGRALTRVISKIGNATFMTNATTAMGFATFIFTHSSVMQQFGVVASINILAVFFLAIIIVPILYSFLSTPKEKHTKHLDRKWLDKAVDYLVLWSTEYRRSVYIITIIVLVVGGIGVSLMKVSGNIADDLPKGGEVRTDLAYFEERFDGVLPFEVVVDCGSPEMMFNPGVLGRIERVQNYLQEQEEVSKSVSIVDAIKFLRQAYYKGKEERYALDLSSRGIASLKKISDYLKNSGLGEGIDNGFVSSDSSITRISAQVADVGTRHMDSLLARVTPVIDTLLNPNEEAFQKAITDFRSRGAEDRKVFLVNFLEQYTTLEPRLLDQISREDSTLALSIQMGDVELIDAVSDARFESWFAATLKAQHLGINLTGTSIVFTKGTNYLVKNLFISLLIAICVIAVLMALLFRSIRMVFVSLLPNLIPLIVTASIMGYFGVPIKPSTILVFSVAFGISVDDTIHFLAKYRQELKHQRWDIRGSVIKSIRETGVSMIYTSIVLFFGFSIFIASNFGGTQALGILISVTLLVAMLANLVLLPSLLLSLEKRITTKAFREPLLELFDEEEDIELEELEVEK